MCTLWFRRHMVTVTFLTSVILCCTVVGMESSRWIPLTSSELAGRHVGQYQQKKCCILPELTSCEDNEAWKCHAGPVYCSPNQVVEDSCGAATCADDTRPTAYCSTISTGTYTGHKCISTGQSNTDGCAAARSLVSVRSSRKL